MRTIRISIALVLLFTAAAILTACSEFSLGSARDNIQKSFRVEPGGNLTLDSDSGSIEINSDAVNEVRINVEREVRGATDEQADKILKSMDLQFRQEGNNLYIQARRPAGHLLGSSNGNPLRLRFVVTVPRKYNLDLKTGGGSIDVRDLQGTVVAQTSGGSLHFGQIEGPVKGHTSGGSIHVEKGSGPVDVNTSGGSIHIGEANGPVTAHTSGGSISVDEVRGRIQASTSGGHIGAKISKQPEGDCELKTSGGSIDVRLARDLNLNLLATTSAGSVRANFPLSFQGDISRSRVEGKMNQGGPQLRIHTSAGSISIDEAK
jgi:DUF4097 and DUF4098 domain-containing protein YvlB